MKKAERDLKIMTESADKWVDETVEGYGGIPMNPSYLDGMSRCAGVSGRSETTVKRDGTIMSDEERKNLMNYRLLQRKHWLDNRNKKGGKI